MVLSSQAQRRGPRSYVSSFRRRKQRRTRRWVGTLVVLGVVGYIAWYWMSDSGIPTAADDSTMTASTAAPQGSSASQYTASNHSTAQTAPTQPPRPDRITQDKLTPPPTVDAAPKPAPAKPEPTPAPPSKPVTSAPSAASSTAAPNASTNRLLDAANQMISQGQTLKGRDLLNQALGRAGSEADAAAIRQKMMALNQDLIFSPKVTEGDPWAQVYIVQSGDVLANIAKQYNVPWEFISYINGNLDPRRLRVGARLKVVQGPLHAIVDKSAFRMDVYLGKPEPGAAGSMYVRSFQVGLGEYDATPVGEFIVKRHSKLKNPEWTNPRTGEKYLADDPKNPLGEFWVGLQGVDQNTEVLKGYGIHGTIEPETIGTQASMGCVRMRDADIELVYAMLSEEISHIFIQR
ncbi:L,D-transpeptidase family protein [Planctomycetales bacterium ZRK34]|nr:L,D-transpeptidase family protein [Planctomycetales bacterium ZRK34]